MKNNNNLTTHIWLEGYGIPEKIFQTKSNIYSHQKHAFKQKIKQAISSPNKTHYGNWINTFINAWGTLLCRFATTDSIPLGIGYCPGTKQRELKCNHRVTMIDFKTNVRNTADHLSEKNKIKKYDIKLSNYLILIKKNDLNSKNDYKLNPNLHPLIVVIDEEKPNEIIIHYNCNKLSKDSIKSLILHLDLILEKMLVTKTVPFIDSEIITNNERKLLLNKYCEIEYKFKCKKSILCFHDQFKQVAKKSPDKLAIADGELINYKELDILSDSLAAELISRGVKPNDNVCLLTERTSSLIMAMLAIMKTGACYVPINHKYPPDKINHVLNDVKARIILVNDLDRIEKKYHDVCIEISDEWHNNKEVFTKKKVALPKLRPEDNAYIIFTSGTTGNPKGVVIQHKSLINLIYWYQGFFGINSKDRSSQFASQGFDSYICEVIPFLAVGGSIHIVDDHTKLSPPDFFKWIESEGITISDLPTAYAKMLFLLQWPKCNKLRLIKIGGETLTNYPNQKFNFDIWNGYGPSETTVETTYYQVYKAHTKARYLNENIKPPIGKPIVNAKAYIVDKNLNLLPIGIAGELLIGGEGIASGYLNREEQTAKSFISNPFDKGDKNKLYRTGDLARWLPDGNLEFLGRIDHQVKIHGYRIELDEVRKSLDQFPDVSEVVVLAKENINNEKSLIAYVEPNLNKNRFLYQERCLVSIGPSNYLEAISEDISKDGIAVSGISETLRPGQKLKVIIKLPGSSDTKILSGHLVWQQDNRSGIQFDLSEEIRQELSTSIDYYISTHNVMDLILSSAAKRNLKKALKNRLPEYMIPPVFVNLLKFPLTFSGKIDIKSLPPPQEFEQITHHANIEPKSKTERNILKIWKSILKRKHISMTDNFFDIGGNSLTLAELSIKMLETFKISIPIDILFNLPYIPFVAKYIDSNNSQTSKSATDDEIERDENLHEDLIPNASIKSKNFKPESILLTGAGGFLGIYLLRELARQTNAKIYCLIRPGEQGTAVKKLISAIGNFNLENDISLKNRNIVAIAGDLSLEHFGLPLEQYKALAKNVDLIIHCGAQVNTMASYHKLHSSNVHGTIEVIKFALNTVDKPIHYISTLSSAVRKNKDGEFVEKFPTKKHNDLYTGYAISKWVSERLLTQLKHRGIPVAIYRSGYISGQSDTGVTNTNDALFMLIKGCIQLGFAPIMQERITILPVDYVSKLITSIATRHSLQSSVYHIDHPSGIMWLDLVAWLNSYGFKVKLISLTKWQKLLLEIPQSNALYPLIPYYLSLKEDYHSTEVDTSKAAEIANKLKLPFPEITDELLNKYFDYLCNIDFLPRPSTKRKKSDISND